MTNLKSARTQLVKETMQFARTMGDIEALARSKWGKGAGSGTVQEYIDQEKLNALMNGFQKMAKTLEVINADMNAYEAKQAKQDISIVKAGQANLRVMTNVAPEVIRDEVVAGRDVPEWAVGLKMMDPELYTKNGRIYYSTIGLTPRDIQYNEFDLEMISDLFDLADTDFIRERWPTFANKVKEYTNCTLGEFIRTYAERRGIEYTAKKRGRKSQSEVQE